MSLFFGENSEIELATAAGKNEDSALDANAVKKRQVALSDIEARDEPLHFAYTYWEGKRKGGLLPCRNDIDILDLRPVLKNTHMVDVTNDDPEAWTFKVVSSVVPRDWEWLAGRPALSACPSVPLRTMMVEDYGAARFTGVPTYFEIAARVSWVEYTYSRIILPLSDDGRVVDTLMVCISRRDIPDLKTSLDG